MVWCFEPSCHYLWVFANVRVCEMTHAVGLRNRDFEKPPGLKCRFFARIWADGAGGGKWWFLDSEFCGGELLDWYRF